MMKRVLALVAVLLATAGVAWAADVKSGLAVGEFVGAFDVKDCSGPSEGKTLCYRCQYGNNPVVAVFTRRLGDDVASLVKQIDDTVGQNKGKSMKAFVVYLSDEPDAAEPKLKAMAKTQKLSNTPLTVFQTSEGPDGYKIARDADVTVMVWNKGKVQANHAFGKDKLAEKDVKAVVAAAGNVVK
ncbi:MAG: hypothetical protein ACKOBW_00405 [Planctomycetota bacterium]